MSRFYEDNNMSVIFYSLDACSSDYMETQTGASVSMKDLRYFLKNSKCLQHIFLYIGEQGIAITMQQP